MSAAVFTALVIIMSAETVSIGGKITESHRNITECTCAKSLGECLIKTNIYGGIENSLKTSDKEEEFLKKMNPRYGEEFKKSMKEEYFRYENIKINSYEREDTGYVENKRRFIYFRASYTYDNGKIIKPGENIYRIENPYCRYGKDKIKKGLSTKELKALVTKIK